MKIAIDLNGGDKAPQAVIKGMLWALKRGYIKADQLCAIGDEQSLLAMHQEKSLRRIDFETATEKVAMADKPREIIKKKDSAMARGLRGIKENRFDAIVSAGNTAGMITLGINILSRLGRGIRPALAAPLPNLQGPCLLIDAGANAHTNALAEDLINFAKMGAIYAKNIWDLNEPKVALLNIGSEDAKGDDTLRLANQQLLDSGLNFIGNIEADKILTSEVNVVACSGIIGNNMLKFGEGVMGIFAKKLGWLWPVLKFWDSRHKDSDHEEVGGAILLGVNGIEIIAHGKAEAPSIANALRAARQEAEIKINTIIATELKDDKDDAENDT